MNDWMIPQAHLGRFGCARIATKFADRERFGQGGALPPLQWMWTRRQVPLAHASGRATRRVRSSPAARDTINLEATRRSGRVSGSRRPPCDGKQIGGKVCSAARYPQTRGRQHRHRDGRRLPRRRARGARYSAAEGIAADFMRVRGFPLRSEMSRRSCAITSSLCRRTEPRCANFVPYSCWKRRAKDQLRLRPECMAAFPLSARDVIEQITLQLEQPKCLLSQSQS